jgi:hypothetical protein
MFIMRMFESSMLYHENIKFGIITPPDWFGTIPEVAMP